MHTSIHPMQVRRTKHPTCSCIPRRFFLPIRIVLVQLDVLVPARQGHPLVAVVVNTSVNLGFG
eukprot:scaffold545_cov372-Pavlova_lutheri.AAC.2